MMTRDVAAPVRRTVRWAWGSLGAIFLVAGLRGHPVLRLAFLLLGGKVLYDVVTETGWIGSARLPWSSRPIKVHRAVTISRVPREELYRFWRDLRNLPKVMRHLDAVQTIDEKRARWQVRGPFGQKIQWDTELTNDQPGELISWKSTDHAQMPNSGTVRFLPGPHDRGTEVHLTLFYDSVAGPVFAAVWHAFGQKPAQQLGEDLARFKMMMETGEIATTTGQPAARPQPFKGKAS